MNQTVIVGKIAEVNKDTLVVSVPRIGEDEQRDLITSRIIGGVAENVNNYCKVGDTIGIKGRLQQDDKGMYLIAEKVTFLSNTK